MTHFRELGHAHAHHKDPLRSRVQWNSRGPPERLYEGGTNPHTLERTRDPLHDMTGLWQSEHYAFGVGRSRLS